MAGNPAATGAMRGHVGRYEQSSNPFDSSESEGSSVSVNADSYTNPFDEESADHEVTSSEKRPASQLWAATPEAVKLTPCDAASATSQRFSGNNNNNNNNNNNEEEDEGDEEQELGEKFEVKLERKLPFSQRSMPHHQVIDAAPKCTVAGNDDGLTQNYESQHQSSFSRRLMPNMRDRDLAMVPRDAYDGREELFEGGSQSAEVYIEASENRALQDLQTYAHEKPRETTATIRNCLRVAEETKEAAGRTMEMLHCQGDQILRTHETAVTVDLHLTVGERILGSIGGIFSMKWKPKMNRAISGPRFSVGENSHGRHMHSDDDRTALGLPLTKATGFHSSSNRLPEQQQHHQQQQQPQQQLVEEDEALTDLSNVLGQLKDMSLQMNSEISKQNESLTHLHDDVQELNHRVKGANIRGRQLLRR